LPIHYQQFVSAIIFLSEAPCQQLYEFTTKVTVFCDVMSCLWMIVTDVLEEPALPEE